MKYTKMHGAGNDFVIIDIDKEKIPADKLSQIAVKLCARRTSIGADGLMAVTHAENGGDYKMLFFNSDGTVGEMCGNGARCIARYGYENGLAGEIQRVETTSGTVIGQRIDKRRYRVKLNDPTVIDLERSADAGDITYECAYIELGNPGLPHAIVQMDGFDEMSRDELRELGRKLRSSKAFPKGANVTFCEAVDRTHVKAVTFERGVEDFTLACGTGAASTATALALEDVTDSENVCISMPGGELVISIDVDEDGARNIFLTGPTNIVSVGEVTDEDLIF